MLQQEVEILVQGYVEIKDSKKVSVSGCKCIVFACGTHRSYEFEKL